MGVGEREGESVCVCLPALRDGYGLIHRGGKHEGGRNVGYVGPGTCWAR